MPRQWPRIGNTILDTLRQGKFTSHIFGKTHRRGNHIAVEKPKKIASCDIYKNFWSWISLREFVLISDIEKIGRVLWVDIIFCSLHCKSEYCVELPYACAWGCDIFAHHKQHYPANPHNEPPIDTSNEHRYEQNSTTPIPIPPECSRP